MVRPRDRLGVTVDPGDWYGTPEGVAYYSRQDPEPAEPRTWTPYPKRGTPMGRTEPGYTRKRKIFKLVFEDPDMEGLIVRTRSTSVRQFLDIQKLADGAKAEDGDEVAATKALLSLFATVIIDWNMHDEEGRPIDPTADALLDEDLDFVLTMITAWQKAVAGVTSGLGKESTPTSPLLEASLPTENLSPSLMSSPELVSSAAS